LDIQRIAVPDKAISIASLKNWDRIKRDKMKGVELFENWKQVRMDLLPKMEGVFSRCIL
jgi:hypothetical protein